MRDQVLRKIEAEVLAHDREIEVPHRPEIPGQELGREHAGQEVRARKIGCPTGVVQLIVLKISFVRAAVRDEEEQRGGKEQGRTGPPVHKRLL